MASLVGKEINGWKVQGVMKCTATQTILKVCSIANEDDKYCMTIKYKDSDNPDYEEGSAQIVSTPINVDVKPTFTYYDNHCFPIVPLENMEGTYEGHEYFVYERISKPLNEIVRSHSMSVTKDDLINVAIQIFGILRHLFAKKMILKNLHVDDFSLRRTTKGYRVVLVNQNFFDSQPFDIDDTTFTSVSVMHGNSPTMSDNVISAVYIMLYLINSSLPWIDETVDKTLSQKMDEDLILSLCGDDWKVLHGMLNRFNLGITQMGLLNQYTVALRGMTKEKNITFGTTLSKKAKQKKVPERIRAEPMVTEAHESVSLQESQPEPVIPESEEVEHTQTVEPSESVEANPEKDESVPQSEKDAEPEQQSEKEEADPQQNEKPVESVEEQEKEDEPVKPEMETSQSQDNSEGSVQPEQTIVTPEDTSKPTSTMLLESLKSLFLTKRSLKRDHENGPEFAGKKLNIHTIEAKSITSGVRGYLTSATFTNLLLASGVVLCEAMGL